MHKQVGGLDADTGDTCKQTHHGMWFSVGCPLQTFKTFLLDAPDLVTDEPRRRMSRLSSARVLAGIGSPSGVRSVSSRCSACLSFGLKPRRIDGRRAIRGASGS